MIELAQGDITRLDVDAIANAALLVGAADDADDTGARARRGRGADCSGEGRGSSRRAVKKTFGYTLGELLTERLASSASDVPRV